MKVKVLAPEVMVGDQKYEAGKSVEIKDDELLLERFLRWGYVVEETDEPPTPKAMTPANKGRAPENKEA